IAAGRCTSAATRSGRRPCLRRRFASFAAVVVFPDPCRPASTTTVGGRSARASGVASLPSISTSASWTIFTTCCAPVIDSSTFAPSARSRTVATSWRTTLKFTSASSSATRTSRSASSRSASVTRGRPRRRSNVTVSLSESCSNIGWALGSRVLLPREERAQLAGRDLGAVEVALHDLHAEAVQGRFLLGRLDRIGDDARARRSGGPDDRLDGVRVLEDLLRDGKRDLLGVEGEVRGRRRAEDELLRSEADAERADRHEPFDQRGVGERPARRLELDPAGIDAGLGKTAEDDVDRVRPLERSAPDVRRDQRDLDAVLAPLHELRARRAHDPAIELRVQAALLDERDDLGGPDQPVDWVRPAHERLDALERPVRHPDLRLEVQRQEVALDRSLQIGGTKLERGHQPEYAAGSSASTNFRASIGTRSSAFSPTPRNFTGSLSSCAIAKTAPPFAVPSSFVTTIPVTAAVAVNCRACWIAFCPAVPSSTRRTSSGAPERARPVTRTIFPSSSMSWPFVWSRPAVSAMTVVFPRALAAFTASNTTAAGSPSGFPLTMGTATRSAQRSSCSMAAARNVSAAASSGRSPASFRRFASFAAVVVFPLPFTPTTRTTRGVAPSPPSAVSPASAPTSVSRTASRSFGTVVTSAVATRSRTCAMSGSTSDTERSARSSPSSSASSHSGVTFSARPRPKRRARKPVRVFSRPESRVTRPVCGQPARTASSSESRSEITFETPPSSIETP